MHRVAEEIESLLRRANLTTTDFLDVTDKLISNAYDIEGQIITVMAPLSWAERQQVMRDLAEVDELTKAGR